MASGGWSTATWGGCIELATGRDEFDKGDKVREAAFDEFFAVSLPLLLD